MPYIAYLYMAVVGVLIGLGMGFIGVWQIAHGHWIFGLVDFALAVFNLYNANSSLNTYHQLKRLNEKWDSLQEEIENHND